MHVTIMKIWELLIVFCVSKFDQNENERVQKLTND